MTSQAAKRVKLGILAFLIATALFLYFMTPLGNYVTRDNIEMIVEMAGIFGPLVYGIIYIVAILLMIPATIFSVFAGALFGTLWGTVLVVTSATIAATLAFLITRRIEGNEHIRTQNKTVDTLMKSIGKRSVQNGLQLIIVLRLLFLPYIALSYACGFVKEIRLRDFVLGTFLTNIIGSFTFVYLGDSIGRGWSALLIPVVLIAFTLLIPKVVKKMRKDIPKTIPR